MTSPSPARPGPDPIERPTSAVALIVIGLLLLGLGLAPTLTSRLGGGGLVGKPAPEVSLLVAANRAGAVDEGGTVSLAQLRGQPVLLDFWASWCGPCAAQSPILERLAKRHAAKGLVVLGVNVDDPPEVAKTYAARKKLSYPIVVDETEQAKRAYGVTSLPTLVVVDREGRVRGAWAGLVDEASLDEALAEVL